MNVGANMGKMKIPPCGRELQLSRTSWRKELLMELYKTKRIFRIQKEILNKKSQTNYLNQDPWARNDKYWSFHRKEIICSASSPTQRSYGSTKKDLEYRSSSSLKNIKIPLIVFFISTIFQTFEMELGDLLTLLYIAILAILIFVTNRLFVGKFLKTYLRHIPKNN